MVFWKTKDCHIAALWQYEPPAARLNHTWNFIYKSYLSTKQLTRLTDRVQDLVQRLSFYCSTLNNIIALRIQVIFCFLDANRGWFLIAWAVLSKLYWKQITFLWKSYIKSHDKLLWSRSCPSTSINLDVRMCLGHSMSVCVVPWYSRVSPAGCCMENLFLIGFVDDNRNFAVVCACSWR